MASPQFVDYRPLMNPDAIVIYPSRKKLLLIAFGSALFVALGLCMIFFKPATTAERVVLMVCTAFAAFPLLFAMVRLLRPAPALVIHPSGLFDNASALSAGFLRWDEISCMGIASMKGQRSLAIVVKDLDALLARQSSFKAKMMKMNVGLLGAAVNIPANTLPISLEELIQTIQQKCPAIQVVS